MIIFTLHGHLGFDRIGDETLLMRQMMQALFILGRGHLLPAVGDAGVKGDRSRFYKDFQDFAAKSDRKTSELIRDAMEEYRPQHIERHTTVRNRRL